MEKRSAMDFALSKLNYRLRTEKEMERLLKDSNYPISEIEETISALKDFNYVDDKRYVEEYFRLSKGKFWADRRIILSLNEKGIGEGFAKEVISSFRDDYPTDSDLALSLSKKMASESEIDEKLKGRIARRLNSLGYTNGDIFKAIESLKE